ncbi:MAG: hypothetical protein K6E40_18495, partial [Desulfovibrio sp.]|nr:hypothetical protein [Desulfovibrio sp.]
HVVNYLAGIGVDISACIVDGRYCEFSNIDIFYDENHNLKIPFLAIIKSNDEEFKKLIKENLSSIIDDKNIVQYDGYSAYIIKEKIYVGKNKDNPANIYLVLELLHEEDEIEKYLKKNKNKEIDISEFYDFLSAQGLFCLISGNDLPCSRILPEYCQRQPVEQLFGCLKDYAKIQPIRNWKESTVQGHMLLSYAALCACRLMQSRLDAAGLPFGPSLELMRIQKCTRYKRRIVVDFPQKPARETYKALGIQCPSTMAIVGAGLRYAPPASEHALDEGGGQAGGSADPSESGGGTGHAGQDAGGRQKQESVPPEQEEARPKRGAGRPKGSKNKKTLEREAQERIEEEAKKRAEEEAKPKRGAGRPKGAKNKKTLEREAQERIEEEARKRAEEEAKPKRGAGRPKGSKNKKTLEREAEYRARAGLEPKRGRGRPKGSKNKKIEGEDTTSAEQEQAHAQARD